VHSIAELNMRVYRVIDSTYWFTHLDKLIAQQNKLYL